MSCFEEALILEVRKYDIVYNKNNPNYTDPDYRNPAWEAIAKKLGFDVEICKGTWSKLRNCHHQALVRRAKKPMNRQLKRWRFEDLMSFLNKDNDATMQSTSSEERSVVTVAMPGQPDDDDQSYQSLVEYAPSLNDIEYVEGDTVQEEITYEIEGVQNQVQGYLKSGVDCSNVPDGIEEILEVDDAEIFEITQYEEGQQPVEDECSSDGNKIVQLYEIDTNAPKQQLFQQNLEPQQQCQISVQSTVVYHSQSQTQQHIVQENPEENAMIIEDEGSPPDVAYENADETDIFFENLNRTLKKLPEMEQTRLKSQFLKMMNEAELRQMNLSPDTTQTSPEMTDSNLEISEHLKILTSQFEDDLTASKNLEAYLVKLIDSLDAQTKSSNQPINFGDMRDQDFMFLLSLVDDFKQVPSANKMLLKAQIAMHIAKALNP